MPNSRYVIYAYFFDDRTAYIGQTQTHRGKSRQYEHKCRGAISSKLESSKSFEFKILEELKSSPIEATERERFWLERISSDGWKTLNKVVPGQPCISYRKWTLESITNESIKFKSLLEWRTQSNSSYQAAQKRGLLHSLSVRMVHPKRTYTPKNYRVCDKLNARITIRLEDWVFQAIKTLPPTEKQNLICAIRKLLEHEARHNSSPDR